MAIIYKQFQAEDVEHYLDSYCTTIENLVPAGEQTVELLTDSLEKIIAQGTIVHIAVDEEADEIVGTASVMIEQKLHRGGVKAGHLEDVSTREGRGGNGIASQLIKNCIESAKEAGCYKIILDCKEDLAGYYEKFDFKVSGIQMKMYV